ncbi:MAG: site-specific DNA-methyltransferase [Anaerolineales bacterium]|nr:site-specific DNA-methyltransferase [Anaerolineales bacterium]MCW5854577.1 site-specific DNA-methyltransferase [Anaerolineales bacterium]
MPKRKPIKKKPVTTAAPVSSYKHETKRVRIPTQEESEKLPARQKQPVKKKYAYDPSLDPQLVWAGKEEQGAEFSVPTVPIYVQEKIAPEAIIARLKLGADENAQMMLFGETAETQIAKAVEFYEHEDNWQNRMILGDSLLVMNSLLEKERMRGKVQCIYIDPPYGIKFGSNWQVSTRKRDVKENKVEDFVRQPEQVKAFRDTWELGIHSYLTYLLQRLTTARELLDQSGSCFVQISDENVHFVRTLMDQVFGANNFVSQITFQKTGGFGSSTLDNVSDYIVWYAKDKSNLKYRQLYYLKTPDQGYEAYNKVELADGTVRNLSKQEKQDWGTVSGRIFRTQILESAGASSKDQIFNFEGRKYTPSSGAHWKTSLDGLEKLAALGRIVKTGSGLSYKRYLDDLPVTPLINLWSDTASGSGMQKVYVVQTNQIVIQRCILMTTDPGDIVLDPTCGSGTTAYVAEQWGRRWITTDTSRVALALARTRLMSAKYPYYRLKDEASISMGFEYKTVPHITLKSLANDEEPAQEILYDQPLEAKDLVRVAGPFTVESLSPHRVSDRQELLSTERFAQTIVENMLKAGVQTGEKDARLEFTNLDILPSGPEVQAVGEYQSENGVKKVAVSIGPEFGSVDDDFIRQAARVSKKFADLLVVAATSFDASAFSEPSQVNGLRVLKVKINPDLSMGDLLKKTGSGNLFLAFGEPEIKVREAEGGAQVEVLGVDVYDPVKSEIRSSGSGDPEHDIAAWFVDTNYNDEAFFVTQAYFLGADKPYEKLKKALKAEINEDVWDELYSTTSRPFPKPKTGKIAVKVINHYGDEVMKVVEV